MSVRMLTVILVFAIPLVLITGGLVLGALKILKGNSSRRGTKTQAEEAQMMQAIYHSLAGMEERIEALETLLLERTREDDNP